MAHQKIEKYIFRPMTIIYIPFYTISMYQLFIGIYTCITRGMSHCGLAIYIKKKSILRLKKNYGNPNISPCKNIIFKKASKRNQNPSRY
jgi:hypothetical protein